MNDYIASMRSDGRSWDYIAKETGLHKEAARARYRRWTAEKKPPREKSSFSVAGNRAVGSVSSHRIMSDEDAIKALGVDLEVWKYDDWDWNKWEVGAKSRDIDLDYVDGKATGHVQKGNLVVEPLFQVKIPFIRIKPQPIKWGAVKAAQIELGTLPRVRSKNRSFSKALIFGDSHIGYWRDSRARYLLPFHDRLALDIVVQIAEVEQPEIIIDLGDGSDLAEFSEKFYKSPELLQTAQPMIYERSWLYAQLRTVSPGSKIIVHRGNHDFRIESALSKNLIAACGLRAADMQDDWPVMSLPFLLGLQRMGIEWVEDIFWINNGIFSHHSDIARAGSGDSTKAAVKDTDVSQVSGHNHKREMASRTIHNRSGSREVSVLSPGVTCHTDGRVPARKKRNNWQKGVMLLDYNPDGVEYEPHFGTIEYNRVMIGGRVYEGRDREEEIMEIIGMG